MIRFDAVYFGNYYDPNHIGISVLGVISDDFVGRDQVLVSMGIISVFRCSTINIYLATRQLPKRNWLATAAVFFAIMNVIKIIPYSLTGQWQSDLSVFSL